MKDGPLEEKYRVERVDGKPVVWAFVLEGHDPFSVPALRAYAEACEATHPTLASDLRRAADGFSGVAP